MSVVFTMKNPIFNAHDLYSMVRLSMIKYFPYKASDINSWEVLTIFLRNEMSLDIEITYKPENRGMTFCGKSYELFGHIVMDENEKKRSPAWYASQVAKWHLEDFQQLEDDLNVMRIWLKMNDYVKENLPTDKFLQQEYLMISDARAKTLGY